MMISNESRNECAMAQNCFMNGDVLGAERHYIRAIPNGGGEPYIGLATVAVQRGDFYAAHRLFGKAYAIEPTDRALCGMGLAYLRDGEFTEAWRKFNEALDIYPLNRSAIDGAIKSGMELGLNDEVAERIEAAIALGADDEDLYISLAECRISQGREEMVRDIVEGRTMRVAA